MSTPAFIDAFRALKTPAARREAIAALADEFSNHEWRHVKALADAKPFHFDIIGALPTELVFQVFSYLDISTPFRLQSVSRRWCTLLRTVDICKSKLRAWYDDTIIFEGASYEHCLQAIQKIRRFRTGSYLEVAASKPRDHYHDPIQLDLAALVEDFFIDTVERHRYLRVTNLLTGEGWRACADGREVIVEIAASDQLVTFRTFNSRYYVYDYSGMRKTKFQLPPTMSCVLACGCRTVICGGKVDQHIELYIWDLDSQKGETLRLDRPHFNFGDDVDCVSIAVLPNRRDRTFTFFTTKTCQIQVCGHKNLQLAIKYYHITFEGQLIRQNWYIPAEPTDLTTLTTNFTKPRISSIRPVDRCGGYQVNLFRGHHSEELHYNSFFFDENLQASSDPAGQDCLDKQCWPNSVIISWFKDSFYQLIAQSEIESDPPKFDFVLAHLDTSGEHRVATVRLGDGCARLLLNDKFAVIFGRKETVVFSFGTQIKITNREEIEMPGDKGMVLWPTAPLL